MIAPARTAARYLERARAELAGLEARALRRTVRERVPPGAIDFSSNDYLGLARDPRVVAALASAVRVGSGGARLLGGAHTEHAALEARLARFVGREAALLFSSGYLAALGGIGTLARLTTRATSDALIHASLIDGLRATRLPRTIAPHASLETGYAADGAHATLVVAESLYGMDGDALEVAALAERLGARDVAFIDEAHALGVAGPGGAGLCAGVDDARIVVLGTLSKSLGAAGGFIAGPREVIELAQSIARGFVFDTAAPPAIVAAAHAALDIVASDDGERLRETLRANVARLRERLETSGIGAPHSATVPRPHADAPLVSIRIGDAARALAISRELEARGFYAPAIRPPTVPAGTSRLRLAVRADHDAREIDAFVTALSEALALHDTSASHDTNVPSDPPIARPPNPR